MQLKAAFDSVLIKIKMILHVSVNYNAGPIPHFDLFRTNVIPVSRNTKNIQEYKVLKQPRRAVTNTLF